MPTHCDVRVPSQRRLGLLDTVDEDETAIPIRPEGSRASIVVAAPAVPQSKFILITNVMVQRSLTKIACCAAAVTVGLLFVCIASAGLLFALHEHHHVTHNIPNEIEVGACVLFLPFFLNPQHLLPADFT